jgi:hypothetical protein
VAAVRFGRYPVPSIREYAAVTDKSEDKMPEDLMRYDHLAQMALRGVVR